MGVLINLIVTPIAVMVIGLLGYFVGVLVALVPFINDLFVAGIGLQHSAIPSIMAWLFVLAFMTNMYGSSRGDD